MSGGQDRVHPTGQQATGQRRSQTCEPSHSLPAAAVHDDANQRSGHPSGRKLAVRAVRVPSERSRVIEREMPRGTAAADRVDCRGAGAGIPGVHRARSAPHAAATGRGRGDPPGAARRLGAAADRRRGGAGADRDQRRSCRAGGHARAMPAAAGQLAGTIAPVQLCRRHRT